VNAAVQRLRAEIASDRRAYLARAEELRALELRAGTSPPVLAQAAVALHHAYCAVEAILDRVARMLEGSLPGGADWYVALLETMSLDIEGVRPAVLSQSSLPLLRRLLSFRHFFRHAYSTALDAERLSALRQDALDLGPMLEKDLARLDDYLAAVARTNP
jgi:hypothetical protein